MHKCCTLHILPVYFKVCTHVLTKRNNQKSQEHLFYSSINSHVWKAFLFDSKLDQRLKFVARHSSFLFPLLRGHLLQLPQLLLLLQGADGGGAGEAALHLLDVLLLLLQPLHLLHNDVHVEASVHNFPLREEVFQIKHGQTFLCRLLLFLLWRRRLFLLIQFFLATRCILGLVYRRPTLPPRRSLSNRCRRWARKTG